MKDLITLDGYKTYKGISESTEDNKILQIISNVSHLVKHFCGRSLIDYYDTDKVEIHNGRFSTLYLKELPLVAISAVERSDDFGETYTSLAEFKDYIIDYENSSITTGTQTPFSSAPITINSIRITYRGGYSECPEDLKIACYDIVEYYREEEYIPKKVMAGATSDNEVFRLMRSERFPIHIQRVLNLYRVVI